MSRLPDIWREMERPFETGWNLEEPQFLRSWRPLLRRLDDMLAEANTNIPSSFKENWAVPRVEVEVSKDHYLLSIDMPGLKKSEISVEVQGDQLAIFGENQYERKEGNGAEKTTERRFRRYERRMALPVGVKAEQIEAQFEDGVLNILVPKGTAQGKQSIKIGEGKGSFFSKLLGERHKKESGTTSAKKPEEKVANQ